LRIGLRCVRGQNTSMTAKASAATGSSTRHRLVHPAAIATDSRRAMTACQPADRTSNSPR
jgi:predicted transglutaminase-like cysteine proteinase